MMHILDVPRHRPALLIALVLIIIAAVAIVFDIPSTAPQLQRVERSESTARKPQLPSGPSIEEMIPLFHPHLGRSPP